MVNNGYTACSLLYKIYNCLRLIFIINTMLTISGYNVPTRYIPYAVAAVVGFFDKTVRMILPMIGMQQKVSNERVSKFFIIFLWLYINYCMNDLYRNVYPPYVMSNMLIICLYVYQMKTVLGVEPRPLPQTILQMCYSLIEQGWVKRTSKYTGPPEGTIMD